VGLGYNGVRMPPVSARTMQGGAINFRSADPQTGSFASKSDEAFFMTLRGKLASSWIDI
jgi:hypothetical protein